MEANNTATFEYLNPIEVITAVETAFGLRLQGSIKSYTSYVNRVYGFKSEDGQDYVAKFYRPGRWSGRQILEEHQLLAECAKAELPVVPPLANLDGHTLTRVTVPAPVEQDPDATASFFYALYPCRAGRTFDTTTDNDWLRLGRLVGRFHSVARAGRAPSRVVCHPAQLTTSQLQELWDTGAVHPDCRNEFFDLAESMLDRISPAFDGLAFQRLHGDCHRGNILDRGPEGLLLVDFDDLMTGPAVQDLWLMLPGRRSEAVRELNLLLEGYGEYGDLDLATLDLIEPLRYMRLVHFLAWCARQRHDAGFPASFPGWGSRSFWIKETEDFRDQDRALREAGF